jgi:tRNA pseudouridine13 synthase
MVNKPTVNFRSRPEDFVVDEIAAYEPCGEGDHLFVHFRKTGLNTAYAVRQLAEALGLDGRNAGTAGMKDRHAVTTQTASFPFAADRDPNEVLALSLAGIEVLASVRHRNKLKTGHLRGNRFRIVLRGLDDDMFAHGDTELARIRANGVPNAFGPQRFGRAGDNAERALEFVRGDKRPPHNKKQRRFLFSALQSKLFNEVLARRVANGTVATLLGGDLAHKHDTGGLFLVPTEGPEFDDARDRASHGLLSATGPMFGAKMRWPEAEPEVIEREVLAATLGDISALEPFKALGKGTRRPLRLWVDGLAWEPNPAEGSLAVSFVLPQGGYATTVLGDAFDLVAPKPANDASGEDAGTPENVP